jgi:hypothetical protein
VRRDERRTSVLTPGARKALLPLGLAVSALVTVWSLGVGTMVDATCQICKMHPTCGFPNACRNVAISVAMAGIGLIGVLTTFVLLLRKPKRGD